MAKRVRTNPHLPLVAWMAVIVAVVYLIVTSGILSLIFDPDVKSGARGGFALERFMAGFPISI